MNCQKCGQETFMPFRCPYCGDQFCSAHRLPEAHDCPKIELVHTPKQKVADGESFTPRASSYEYSISFGQPHQIQRKVYMSPKEAKHLAVAALLVVGIGFSMVFYNDFFGLLGWTWTMAAVFALAITVSFLIHEMGHKVIAQRRGFWAEFRLTTWGAIITALSVISPIRLIAPGAVMISGPSQRKEIAKISIAGPSINIVLCSVFLGVSLVPSSWISLFAIVAYINAIISVFNLIPFGILDGYKIYSYNKVVWAIAFAVAIAVAVPSYLTALPYL
jgi:Zn-dependent protease